METLPLINAHQASFQQNVDQSLANSNAKHSHKIQTEKILWKLIIPESLKGRNAKCTSSEHKAEIERFYEFLIL